MNAIKKDSNIQPTPENKQKDVQKKSDSGQEQIPLKHPHPGKGKNEEQTPRKHPHGEPNVESRDGKPRQKG